MHETPLHSTPRHDGPGAPLPPGVTRCREADPNATLDTCKAVPITLRPLDGAREFSLIVWRDHLAKPRPIGKARFSEARPGDQAVWRGRVLEVVAFEIWR